MRLPRLRDEIPPCPPLEKGGEVRGAGGPDRRAARQAPPFPKGGQGGFRTKGKGHPRLLRLLPLLLLLIPTTATADDPITALNEGNRLFRDGQIEAAVDAYRAGYSPDSPHLTLAYNLGTALHRLDRLPEAILWYRRAGDSQDPWLEENLWLARRTLGSRVLPPGGFTGTLAENAGILKWTSVVLAWIALLLLIVRPRLPLWALLAGFALSGTLYATALGVVHWAPRPSVLLAGCFSDAGELPKGTEAWVRRLPDGRFKVAGTDVRCPAEAVALIHPDRT